MAENWRLLDTGLASPARNIAMSRALLEARHAEEISSTLCFSRFTRCALLGAHHSAAQALDLVYCGDNAIPIQRRITSGPAYYLDERQLVWELYLHRREVGGASLPALARRIGHAVATALSALGVDARIRERTEIEIDGRALGCCGIATEGDALLVQGALLLDAEAPRMLGVLRTPWSGAPEALQREAEARLTSLKHAMARQPELGAVKKNLCEAFESEFEVELRDADPGLSEHARYQAAIQGIATRDWVEHIGGSTDDMPLLSAARETSAGNLSVALTFDRRTRTIRRVWLTSGPVLEPRRCDADLEAALCDVPLEHLAQRIERFFASRALDAAGLRPADFIAVLNRAVHQPLLAGNR
jgi:lipoate-protein ligase A